MKLKTEQTPIATTAVRRLMTLGTSTILGLERSKLGPACTKESYKTARILPVVYGSTSRFL
jgi:hypothetical protein